MKKTLQNCGECGALVRAYESDWVIRCPECERIDTENTAHGLVGLYYQHGRLAAILFLIWIFSPVPALAGMLEFIGAPYSGIANLIFFLLPVWAGLGLFGKITHSNRLSFLGLFVLVFVAIDFYLEWGRTIWFINNLIVF